MPFVQSKNPVRSNSLVAALLAALSARPAAALLTTPTLHLFTAGPTPIKPSQVPADFTEATFAGYAAVVLGTLLGPINLTTLLGQGVHIEGDFLAGAVVAPGQTILGYWVDSGTGTFYLGEAFSAPIPITVPGDFISLDVIFGEPWNLQVS